ncbi:C2 calcium-dependent membrane targeting [Corchorus olitorius]|uniref:C2 calcium-dependent membrane targeting n=1 Tax=Corchorus olitorius TaxID=93759 RepID=A0A1R3KLM6_9ROSI|nr:C2 calcium-dependent membrane targeting [Corchorus olitorius]
MLIQIMCFAVILSASKLRDRDITSKWVSAENVFFLFSYRVIPWLYLKKQDGTLEELGRTEVILNNLNPVWIEKINVSYHFETVQHLVFRVYDVDTKYHDKPVKALKLDEQEFLGEATCVVSEIVTKRDRSLTINLQSKNGAGGSRDLGTITVHAEETRESRIAIEMKLCCSQLDNKDMFSKSDPFLRISRINQSGKLVPICKTEDTPLLIECFDFNNNGNHTLIG